MPACSLWTWKVRICHIWVTNEALLTIKKRKLLRELFRTNIYNAFLNSTKHSLLWKNVSLLLSYCSVFNLSDARLNRLQLSPIGEQPPSLHWVTATPNAINQRGISNQPSSDSMDADLFVGLPSYVWLSTENKWSCPRFLELIQREAIKQNMFANRGIF